MLPIGSVGMLIICVRVVPGHDYGPLRMQGKNLPAASKYRECPMRRDVRDALTCRPTFRV
jgi:hypothetical protein